MISDLGGGPPDPVRGKKPYVETDAERKLRESKLGRLGRLEAKANEGRFEKDQPSQEDKQFIAADAPYIYAHDHEFLRGEADGREGLAPQDTGRTYMAGHMNGQQQRIRAQSAAVQKDAADASTEELEAAERIWNRLQPPTVAELQADVRTWTIQKGWVDDRTVGDLLMLMVSELAEAMEEYRNHHEPNEIRVDHGKPEGIPIELADVVIRILSFCAKYDINLQDAILQKMAYNETREYRHGGKRV